jgi:hypothetical protein
VIRFSFLRDSDSPLEDLDWTRTRVRDSDSKVGDSITSLLSNIICRLLIGKLGITYIQAGKRWQPSL